MWHRVWMYERKGKRGTSYHLRWYGEDGRIKTRAAGRNERNAEQSRRELEMQINSGSFAEESSMKLFDFLKEHLELVKPRLAAASYEEYNACYERFKGFLGDRQLSKITVADCDRYFSWRLSKVRPATANKDRRSMYTAFKRAVRSKYLRENPWASVDLVREPEKDLRVLTHDEVGKLIAACPNLKWRTFVFVAVTTGLRRGELCYLEWGDLNLSAGLLQVRNKTEHRTKSGKNRVVALVPAAVDMLTRLRLSMPGRWVFETENGTLPGNNVLRTFLGIVKRAGIGECTIHDLRRTFISHLAMAGVNEAVVQRLAGHASMETTLKHYTAILPEVARRAPERLPWALGPAIISNSYQIGAQAAAEKTA
jgi:integrase